MQLGYKNIFSKYLKSIDNTMEWNWLSRRWQKNQSSGNENGMSNREPGMKRVRERAAGARARG